MSTPNAPSNPTQNASQLPKPPQLTALEEDDEFEDFPTEDWTEADEDHEDSTLWEDNWDDVEVDDEFTRQLRAELTKPTEMEGQEQQPQQ
ncbi:DSS1/SEM1 family-domain-containing protein [Phlyctochytrium arcticum]|nr:DSS1/SEM1 family-domain-containing protein [Phlyctochytrium arcticum]